MIIEKSRIDELSKLMTNDRIQRMLDILDKRSDYVTVITENFFNPGNISAVVRTIDALGFTDINILEYDFKFNKNKKISKGAEKWINTTKYQNVEECFSSIRDKGYDIYYADPAPENPDIFELPLNKKVAILFGQELPGVTEEAKKLATGGFKLPIHGFVESYNVSVSAALTLFTLRNRLEKEGIDFILGDDKKREIFEKWVDIHLKR